MRESSVGGPRSLASMTESMRTTVDHTGVPVRIERAEKRVRVTFAGATIADSTSALHVSERGLDPIYYVPFDDVRTDLLEPTDTTSHCPRKGDASYWTIVVGDRRSVDAVWSYPNPIDAVAEIAGHVAFYANRVDATIVGDDAES
jgi:uncharacterized protein (DUF427 family)